ncbi:bifunctional 2',3'-cyclic-nucleotide 2'-phosphodiesterase/3'-nucleotidase [Paenibacillus zeisoli]|uniref:Bifunctional 2',3'-cyclic-nucleotide 2'-phosphodiesterase/3'-nucleotidase n=1 Tax=Paenibacillus zeisoli TaxID=2496267 RepID=A0A433X195_9BACL|nr:bifunctional 2',3'-cyclic-nucleotide 2'-phosphodiesterase/3'-nucleotidase [Paenibacillus zeisoli]RUT27889.1 bifunctional 2',3'-cyclic-nucleotide 2'-phosphodiesterase/3'-nucleotidase [Paenibacillus zeisoli]
MELNFRKGFRKAATSTLAVCVLSTQFLAGQMHAAAAEQTVPTVSLLTNQDPTNTTSADTTPADNSDLKLRIMETTDIHTNLMSYDYYKDQVSPTVGLVKTASLVKQAREEVKNTLLVDNGDLIQGTPLGTYMAKIDQLKGENAIHPVYKAMNLMGYDIATFGNHEFNYGLDFLDKSIKGASFPYVNANVYVDDHDNNSNNDKNNFTPYKILDKTYIDENGNTQTVKVGVLGLVTPQIMDWDKGNLEGKVTTKDIVATAEKFVPQMKAEGADIVIALTHSGFDASAEANTMAENAILPLSKVKGIDAITFSHTHKVFPTGDNKSLDVIFKDANGNPIAGVDNVKGTINGVAAVQAGYGGAELGIIDLTLTKDAEGHWKVSNSQSSNREIYDKVNKKPLVDADPAVENAIKVEHEATIQYANGPIGETSTPIYSYFALVKDDPSVQIVTKAQEWFVKNYIAKNAPQYKDLPILSVGAPFKAGRNGPTEYTDIAKGPIAIKSASDLYLYDNTLKAVKIKGSTVKEWLEMSAGMFNQIDPAKTEEQSLLNPKFAVFNFDVIDGVTYQVDVTKPAKYNADGTVNNANSSRIVKLQYNGKDIDPNQDFIVVTNNYRAGGGGNFPGLKGAELVVDSADENRQILMNYITEQKDINPTADKNWSILPVNGKVNVTFTTSPEAVKYLGNSTDIKYTNKTDDKGFGIYSLSLAGGTTPPDPGTPGSNVKVQILGINDFHGQLDTTSNYGAGNVGRADYLAAYLKKARATNPNTLLVHAGDSVGASAPVSSLERDKPTMEFLNMMKFDVGTLGNHEFDQGVPALLAQVKGGADSVKPEIVFDKANFDYINANALYKSPSATDYAPIVKPYVIKEIGGEKVGFIGVVTMATPSKVSPSALAGVKFVEQAPVVNAAVKELQAQGVHAIVVLAHDPASTKDGVTTGEAVDLAKAVDPDVDVIFAGDNHAKVNAVVNNKLIVQAYSYGTAYADVDLEIDPKTHDIIKKQADIVDVKQEGITPDPEVTKFVNDALARHPELTKPVGTTAGAITKTNAYNAESELGNLIADAMKDTMGTDFAFMNPGGIRADLPKGNITFSDLAKIQPFGNSLVKLQVTGAQIKTLLQQQWGKNADGSDNFKTLQISGLKYTADFRRPVEQRVTVLTKEDGTPIDDKTTYTITVNNFMAAGGDNYKVLTQGKDITTGTTVNDLDAFYNYIVKKFKGGTIISSLQGRITNIYNSGNGGSTPTTPSTGDTTPKPNQTPISVVIKPADLPKPQNGVLSVNVNIPQNQASTEVLLPGNLSQLAGDSPVQLNWGTASLSIPKEVVDSLSKLIPSEKQNDSLISLQVNQLTSEQASQISSANSSNGGTLQPASPILELTLSAKDSSGKTTKLDQFSKPVVLNFQVTGQANQALLGVYYIPDSGSMQYVGGKITGNTMTAEVTHFSKYGVFAYDKSYSDVAPGHWANQVIKELTAKHIVNGVTDTSFAPEKEITRAEFAAMLVRQLNLKAAKPVQLEDVSQGSWYADAIAAAYSNGLVNGISQTEFGPDKKITREEMSVMMVKAYNFTTGKNIGSGSVSFKDSENISTWAQDYVGTAVKEGLLKGRSTDIFAPKKQATRAEASQVMYNLIHKM